MVDKEDDVERLLVDKEDGVERDKLIKLCIQWL